MVDRLPITSPEETRGSGAGGDPGTTSVTPRPGSSLPGVEGSLVFEKHL